MHIKYAHKQGATLPAEAWALGPRVNPFSTLPNTLESMGNIMRGCSYITRIFCLKGVKHLDSHSA